MIRDHSKQGDPAVNLAMNCRLFGSPAGISKALHLVSSLRNIANQPRRHRWSRGPIDGIGTQIVARRQGLYQHMKRIDRPGSSRQQLRVPMPDQPGKRHRSRGRRAIRLPHRPVIDHPLIQIVSAERAGIGEWRNLLAAHWRLPSRNRP